MAMAMAMDWNGMELSAERTSSPVQNNQIKSNQINFDLRRNQTPRSAVLFVSLGTLIHGPVVMLWLLLSFFPTCASDNSGSRIIACIPLLPSITAEPASPPQSALLDIRKSHLFHSAALPRPVSIIAFWIPVSPSIRSFIHSSNHRVLP